MKKTKPVTKKAAVKKYQKGGKTDDTLGKTVLKNRKDTTGIKTERAKGNTVYIPKPVSNEKAKQKLREAMEKARKNPFKKGGTHKSKPRSKKR